MCPRYKKSNRKYNVKVPKEKMPFEKKVMIQSAFSAVLMAFLTIYSFATPHPAVSKFLDTTYSWKMWCSFVGDIANSVKTGSAKAVNSYLTFVESAERRFGIQKSTSSTAKAEKPTLSEKEMSPIEEPPLQSPAPQLWHMPCQGEITSPFGKRVHPVTGKEHFHTGVDIGAGLGIPVCAASEGTVSVAGNDSYNGKYVVIDHDDNRKSIYAHLDSICVSEGSVVDCHTQIGTVGSTGVSTGPHLHFEIKAGEESVDPMSIVNFEEG